MFWIGLIVGLFPGALIGFLFAAILSVGRREPTEEPTCERSEEEKDPVSVKFVSEKIGERIGTFE
jgi:hypothetical protein